MNLNALLVAVLIGVLIAYIVYKAPIEQPFKNVLWIVLAAFAILWLLGYMPGHAGPFLR